MFIDSWLQQHKPEIYWPMLQTAKNVAKRYGMSRERMDQFGAESQQKACAAQAAGKFADEIVPITVTAGVADKVLGLRTKQVTVSADEGLREGTTYASVSGIRSAMPGGVVTAGNASQLSDGASACVLMERGLAERRGLKPLGIYRGMAVAGCATTSEPPLPEGARQITVGRERVQQCQQQGGSMSTSRDTEYLPEQSIQ